MEIAITRAEAKHAFHELREQAAAVPDAKMSSLSTTMSSMSGFDMKI